MRYLIAMILGFFTALLIVVYASSPIANWVVYRYKFESPDEVSNLFDAVFIGTALVGLLVGWLIGWLLGGAFQSKSEAL